MTPGVRAVVLWGRARSDGSVTTRLCSSAGTAAPFNLLPPFKPRNVEIKIFNAYFYFRPSGYLYLFPWFLTFFGGRGVALRLPPAPFRFRARPGPLLPGLLPRAAACCDRPHGGYGAKKGKKGAVLRDSGHWPLVFRDLRLWSVRGGLRWAWDRRGLCACGSGGRATRRRVSELHGLPRRLSGSSLTK